MQLFPGIVADAGAVFLEKSKTLVLADLHFGYEEARRSKGVLLPSRQTEILRHEIERLLAIYSPDSVVLAGDLKHEFGRISQEEWREVGKFLRWLGEHVHLDVIIGNHDKLLLPLLLRLRIAPRRFLVIDDVLIVHGDFEIGDLVKRDLLEGRVVHTTISTVLMGHEHPAISVTDGVRSETVKCYLVGTHKVGRKMFNLVVLPSFNPLVEGTDALRERPLGPLLTGFSGFSAFAVVEGKVLAFGSIDLLQRRERQS